MSMGMGLGLGGSVGLVVAGSCSIGGFRFLQGKRLIGLVHWRWLLILPGGLLVALGPGLYMY